MAFRQQIGPPASTKQVQQLLALLKEAGHADFRSARGPLGLTQRQGLGKFTQAEADAIIEQLEREAADVEDRDAAVPIAPARVVQRPLQSTSTEQLIAELHHRGWSASKDS